MGLTVFTGEAGEAKGVWRPLNNLWAVWEMERSKLEILSPKGNSQPLTAEKVMPETAPQRGISSLWSLKTNTNARCP